MQDNDGHYASFLISFYVIAAAWSSHHDIFRYVRRVDHIPAPGPKGPRDPGDPGRPADPAGTGTDGTGEPGTAA